MAQAEITLEKEQARQKKLLPLRVRPRPENGESLASFVVRLSIANSYDPHWITERLGLDDATLTSKSLHLNLSEDQMQDLSVLGGVPSESLSRMTLDRFARSMKLDSEEVARYLNGAVKFCPLCLRKARYHRLFWDFEPITLCPSDSVLLIDECSGCRKTITAQEVVNGTHACGRLLARENGAAPANPVFSQGAQRHLASIFGIEMPSKDDNMVFTGDPFKIPPSEFLLLIDMLTKVLAISREVKERSDGGLRNADRDQLLGKVFHLLHKWPDNFYAFLTEYRKQGQEIQFPSLQGKYRPLGEVIEKSQLGQFAFVHLDFVKYLNTRTVRAISKKNRFLGEDGANQRRYVLVAEAAEMLEIDPWKVKDLIEKRELESALSESDQKELMVTTESIQCLRGKWGNRYTRNGAAKRLGVNVGVVEDLIKGEWLKSEGEHCGVWFVAKKELDELLSRIQQVQIIPTQDESFMTIQEVQSNLFLQGNTISQVISLVAEDSITPLKPYRDPSKTGLPSLLFLLADVKQFAMDNPFVFDGSLECKAQKEIQQSREPAGLTEEKAAEWLGISAASANELLKSGNLKRAQESADRIDAQSVRSFEIGFVLMDRAVSLLNVTSGALLNCVESGLVRNCVEVNIQTVRLYFVPQDEIDELAKGPRNHRSGLLLRPDFPTAYKINEIIMAGLLKPLPDEFSGGGIQLFMQRDCDELVKKAKASVSIMEVATALGTDDRRIDSLFVAKDGESRQQFSQLDIAMLGAPCSLAAALELLNMPPDEAVCELESRAIYSVASKAGERTYRMLEVMELHEANQQAEILRLVANAKSPKS